jgi:hypothetical protein
MKPDAGLAEHRFIGAVRTVQRGFIRELVLHVHAGPGTFEDEAIHPACQSNDWTVFRIDPSQCRTAQGVQSSPRRRHFAKVKQAIEMKEGAELASFARSDPIDRFLDKTNSRAHTRPVSALPQ